MLLKQIIHVIWPIFRLVGSPVQLSASSGANGLQIPGICGQQAQKGGIAVELSKRTGGWGVVGTWNLSSDTLPPGLGVAFLGVEVKRGEGNKLKVNDGVVVQVEERKCSLDGKRSTLNVHKNGSDN